MASHPPTPHRRPNSANSNRGEHYSVDPRSLPLDTVLGSSSLEELSDSMATLDANMQQLQSVHENLSRFSESFSAFLYGIKMNAWCVEFSEAPSGESFRRDRSQVDLEQKTNTDQQQNESVHGEAEKPLDADTTYTTNDNQSFIVEPKKPQQTPVSRRPPPSSSSAGTSFAANRSAASSGTYGTNRSGTTRPQSGIPRKTTTSAAKAKQMAEERAKKTQWRR